MRFGLLLLQDAAAADAAGVVTTIARIASVHGLELREVASLDTCAGMLKDETDVAQLVVIAPSWNKPLLAARRLAREREDARFVIVTTPDKEAALRREAVVGAPPGGRWSIASADDAPLEQAIAEALRAFGTQRRLRTTLERVNLDLRAASTLDPREYRRLVASDRYLASVLEGAHDAIVSLDLKQSIVSWNRAAERLFGVERDAARHLEFASLFPEATTCSADLDAALAGRLDTAEWLFRDPQGVERQLEAALDAVRDETGKPTGWVVILRDVTERHATARALRQASEQKDEFLAMLSHELRNPLAPIRNAAELLARIETSDPRTAKLARTIQRQTSHMTALVEDLLDVASVGRGAVKLERRDVVVSEALADAVEQVSTLMESHAHRLAVHVDAADLLVSGDRRRLTQIFCNVLTNSAKYTPPGGEIDVSMRRDGDDVRVVVKDNGAGIDAETLPRVFDLFAQGQRTTDRSQGGLGVGLAIVKTLTELHGGAVDVSSEGAGMGAAVQIRLPLLPRRAPEALPNQAADMVAVSPLSVMVVDDNEDAARTLGQLLQAIGHVVDVEVDPREALRRAASLAPDVFILDIGMPYLDGYELAKCLLAQRGGNRPILIALTGYGQAADKEQAIQAGFDHHLVKPLDPAKLQRLLDAHVGHPRRPH